MKLFLLKVAFYLSIILLISIPLDYFLSWQLKKSKYYAKDEYSVWNDLYDGKIDSDIAIYGSSRAWVQIDPQLLQDRLGLSAYNLGIDGHNIWLQYMRHELLMKYNKKPEYIIFSLDVFTMEKKEDLYNRDQFLPYMLFNNDMKKYIDGYNGYTLLDFYVPLVRYYGKKSAVKYAVKNSVVPINQDLGRKKGYRGQLEVWNDDLIKASLSMKSYQVVPDTFLISQFTKLISECKEKNIKMIFVYTPEYVEGQKFVANRYEVISLYKNIADKYEIPFLDYSNDELCLKKECFYNASHLNKAGAELFTGKLIHDLSKLTTPRRIAGIL